MTPMPLTNRTRVLDPPRDWNQAEGECLSLEIVDEGGWMTSAWMPNEDELRRLNAGESVLLSIHGRNHPVVGVSVSGEPL